MKMKMHFLTEAPFIVGIIVTVLGLFIMFSIIKEVRNNLIYDKALGEMECTNARVIKVGYLDQVVDSDRLEVTYEFVTKNGLSITASEIVTVKKDESKKFMAGNEIPISYKKGNVKSSKISLLIKGE